MMYPTQIRLPSKALPGPSTTGMPWSRVLRSPSDPSPQLFDNPPAMHRVFASCLSVLAALQDSPPDWPDPAGQGHYTPVDFGAVHYSHDNRLGPGSYTPIC
ncbi:hypothetical protein BDV33DRAFT_186363 [Aspergillus novoparasiticus]|uniref:Uncharacterized protein n=1 Tax=Aspergillus novoparasiticus TaxID=986946 RepID=A0A5N6E728_9EURO|nr:hypothetical protein BDV33DRAFT_186363 [Aspergillus novoparasiticus]